MLTTWLVSRITRHPLVRPEVFRRLGRISGRLLALYALLKCVDTLVWINRTAPASGVDPLFFYRWQPFGILGPCSPRWSCSACSPAFLLIDLGGRRRMGSLLTREERDMLARWPYDELDHLAAPEGVLRLGRVGGRPLARLEGARSGADRRNR